MNVVNKIAASKYFQQVSRLFDCFLFYFIKYKKMLKGSILCYILAFAIVN